MAKKVFIGVGHGGKDPGATANKLKEKDLNLAIAQACNAELVRHGITTQMSRTKDENDDLTEEIKECNAFRPDLAVDIHNNAGGGDGVEAYYTYKGGTGKALAINILDEIVKIGQNSRGAKIRKNTRGTDYFGFIRQTTAPAVLVECAFIDTKDVQIIDTAAEQKKMGVAIAKGILETLGIAYKAGASETNPKETNGGKTVDIEMSVLKKGAKGAQVKTLQRLLMALGYDMKQYGADGSFGGTTDKAVRAYQKNQGLEVDGSVGKATWTKLLKG